MSRGNSKFIVAGKEMSKSFLCDYLTTHYGLAKHHGNVEKRLILSLQENNDTIKWKFSHRNILDMFKLTLLIYGGKIYEKMCQKSWRINL